MVERLTIDHLGTRGDGIVSADRGPIYVPYALPGEIVEVDPWPGHPDRRNLLRVETASPARILPICAHFGTCGGCALQHWDSTHYRAWKRDTVVAQLRRASIAANVADLIDAHGEGRRRAVLHARRCTYDILKVGFAALHAHRIVSIDRCPILAPGLTGLIDAAWAIAETLKPTAKPLDIQATATDDGIDVDVRGSGPLTAPLMLALARVAETHRLARITRHGELVAQRITPRVRVGRATVALPPGAFLQATALGEETLAQLVLRHIADAKSVADLFAGVGPFALRLAERARVLAVDSDAGAIDALRRASAATRGLKPIIAERRDLFRRPFLAQELVGLDAVVFDPPRQGAEAQARELAKSPVPTIVAVSCNAATFGRDTKLLIDGGYRLGDVTPVDQFRYSAHVEIVAQFVR
ncbi:MAG TPA: RNA methyltransferase [Xanthobacteraceae bacterium]|nr:RNA methyltransferase [Xanthobacteraceae bacterium]